MSMEESERDDDDGGRYAALTLNADDFVIYDRENHRAWVQSSVSFPVEKLR